MQHSVAYALNRHLLKVNFLVGLGAIVTFGILSLTADGHRQALGGMTFGISLFCCALCSLLYETSEQSTRRAILRLLDHSAIFVLIAGTYTPFVISGITGPFGIGLLTWIWSLAIIGISLKLLLRQRYDNVFVLLYVALGWFCVAGLGDLIVKTPTVAFALLAAGGIAYTLGAVIFWRGAGRWTDSIWHGFVLVGFVLHFAAVLSLTLAA